MEFNEWFCLKGRDSFSIDPKVTPSDARFYFGRDDIRSGVMREISSSFVDPGVPKMIIYGPYGSGKTQMLYHIKHCLMDKRPRNCKYKPLLIHLDLEMQKKSRHSHWHSQLMESLGKETVVKWLEQIPQMGEKLDVQLSLLFDDPNVVECMKKLLISGDVALSAWRWLCGQAMATKDLNALRVTRTLGELCVEDLTKCLIGIGNLAKKNGEVIIFLMDEAEQFQDVTDPESYKLLHDYERRLCEQSNSSIGFIMAGFSLSPNDMPEWYIRADIRRRLGQNKIKEIGFLPAVSEVKKFICELIAELVDRGKAEPKIKDGKLKTSVEYFPFTEESLEKICQQATQDPTKALPSHIIKTINECAIRAFDEDRVLIEDNIVDAVAPAIFE
jgi:hypothetical protein